MAVMREEKHRVAVIGLGPMGHQHTRAWLAQPKAQVVAAADINPERIQKFRGEFPNVPIYSDAQALLAKEAPHIVSIATNPPSHAELTIAAAEAGARAVFCEKAMATSLREADQMIQTCQDNRIFLQINHTSRWRPFVTWLKAVMETEPVGKIQHVTITWSTARMGCLLTHFIDLVRYLTNLEPTQLVAFLDRTGTPDPRGPQFRDPGGTGIAFLNDGARLLVDGMEDLRCPVEFEMMGHSGRIRFEFGGQWADYWIPRPGSSGLRDWIPAEFPMPLPSKEERSREANMGANRLAAADLIHNLENNLPPRCSGEDGRASLEFVIAFHLSEQRGNRPVRFPVDDLDFRLMSG